MTSEKKFERLKSQNSLRQANNSKLSQRNWLKISRARSRTLANLPILMVSSINYAFFFIRDKFRFFQADTADLPIHIVKETSSLQRQRIPGLTQCRITKNYPTLGITALPCADDEVSNTENNNFTKHFFSELDEVRITELEKPSPFRELQPIPEDQYDEPGLKNLGFIIIYYICC